MPAASPAGLSLADWRAATREGRFQIVGSRVRGEARPDSDWDLLTVLTREEAAAWKAGDGFPAEIVQKLREVRRRPNGGSVFIVVEQPHPHVPGEWERNLYEVLGPRRAKWVHRHAVAIAGGFPKAPLPRPDYSIAPLAGAWTVTAYQGLPEQLYQPLPGEVFATATAALARARQITAAAPWPPYFTEPGWLSHLAAGYAWEQDRRSSPRRAQVG